MSDETPKLRLKPRLTAESAAAPVSGPPSSVPPAPTPPPASPAASLPSVDAAPAPTPVTEPPPKPKIVLRPRTEAAAPAVAAPPPMSMPVATSSVPPSIAAAKAPADLAPPALPPPLPAPASGTVDPAAAKKVQRVALGIGLAGAVVFVLIAWIAYPRLMTQAKAFAATEVEGADDAEVTTEEPAERPDAAANVSAVPAQAAPTKLAPTTPPVSSASTPPTRPAQPAGVENAPTESSEGLKAWANGLKIGGVRGGATPRALINGVSYNLGDVVNAELGVTFDSYDAKRHVLRFRDRSGAIVERRDR